MNCDRGIVYTVKELYTRPGGMITDYLNGRRIRYFAPFQMLFVVAAITLFFSSVLGIYENLFTNQLAVETPLSCFGVKLVRYVVTYNAVVNVLLIPFTGCFFRWLYGRSFRQRYNWVETFFIVAYVQVQRDIFCLFLLPVFLLLGNQEVAGLISLVGILLGTWCFREITGKSWLGNLWRVVLVTMFYYIVICLMVSVILAIYLVLYEGNAVL